MTTARQGPGAAPVTIGGASGVLAVGGKTSGAWTSTTEFYQPATNSWVSRASMPTARWGLAAAPVTVSGAAGILAVGGRNAMNLANAEFYDPVVDTWFAKAPMPTARRSLAAAPATISGVAGVLVVGGANLSGQLSTAEFYDPVSDTWTLKAPMLTARNALAAAPVTISGVAGVLAVGGNDGTNPLSIVEFYDPTADSWRSMTPMITARQGLAAAPVTLGGAMGVLAVGGGGNYGYFSAAEFYNPAASSWSAVTQMPTARQALGAASVTVGGVTGVLAVGGTNNGGTLALSTAELYCP